MTYRQRFITLVLGAITLGGCLRTFVPAPFGTPLDEVCNPMNGNLPAQLDTFVVGPSVVQVPKGWSARFGSSQDLTLRRMDTELNVWLGSRFLFPGAEPRNAVRCTIGRGDTTVSIQATRLGSFEYRVDAAWQPLVAGQYYYLQLQTRYVEQLKSVRAIIEGVHFPVDTLIRIREKR